MFPPVEETQIRFGGLTLVQARRHTPPKRVRHPTDRQFASGYSPPRLATAQLPSATELWPTPTGTFTLQVARPHGRTGTALTGSPPHRPGRAVFLASGSSVALASARRTDHRPPDAIALSEIGSCCSDPKVSGMSFLCGLRASVKSFPMYVAFPHSDYYA
jgi:hypothetical protein